MVSNDEYFNVEAVKLRQAKDIKHAEIANLRRQVEQKHRAINKYIDNINQQIRARETDIRVAPNKQLGAPKNRAFKLKEIMELKSRIVADKRRELANMRDSINLRIKGLEKEIILLEQQAKDLESR